MIDGKSGQRKIKTLIKSVDEASHQYMRLNHDCGTFFNSVVMNLNRSVCLGSVFFFFDGKRVMWQFFSWSTEVHRWGHADVHVDARGGNRLQVGLKSWKTRHLTSDQKNAQNKPMCEVQLWSFSQPLLDSTSVQFYTSTAVPDQYWSVFFSLTSI